MSRPSRERAGRRVSAGRIAVLLDPAADRYGASRFTAALADEVARSGVPAEIWVPFDHGIGGLLQADGASVRIVPVPILRRSEWRHPARAARAALRLTRQLAGLVRAAWSVRGRVAAVHAVGLSSVAGIVVAGLSRAPLHWSVHETVQNDAERRFSATLLRRASRIYACSGYVADQFPDLPITVAHTGTHLVDGDLPLPPPPFADGAVPTILCVGRINGWKGQDVLLRALAPLAAEGLPFTCRLVGGAFPGNEHLLDALRDELAASGLGDRVHIDGEVADPVGVFAAADVVVVPSTLPEPFGKVVVEAMALGRPVVATAPGGPAEVIRPGVDGLLVPTGDVAALTGALRDLLADPALARRLGAAAAVRAQDFSEAATVRRIAGDIVPAEEVARARG
jgi:glycosyltransferase involved in cell wall biosynthesis